MEKFEIRLSALKNRTTRYLLSRSIRENKTVPELLIEEADKNIERNAPEDVSDHSRKDSIKNPKINNNQ